jgi:hypothetical protein
MNLTESRYTMVSYVSDFGPAAGCCEHDTEPVGSIKENLTILLSASQGLCSMKLVSPTTAQVSDLLYILAA